MPGHDSAEQTLDERAQLDPARRVKLAGDGRFADGRLHAPTMLPFAAGASKRYAEAVLTRADDLAKLEVLDERGAAVELGSLWRERPVVLVFVRHFG